MANSFPTKVLLIRKKEEDIASSFYVEVLRGEAKLPLEGSSTSVKTKLRLPVIVHPNVSSGKIVINYPGFQADIDGHNNRHKKLAEFLQKKIGAAIYSGNNHYYGFDYGKSVQEDLRMVIRYATSLLAQKICGSDKPAIYLMGFSAGASAIAAVAYEFPEVKKILLISPSGDAGDEDMKKGLAKFSGEVYIVAGANDDIVGPRVAPRVWSMAKRASVRKLVIVPDCDHHFRGTKNRMILSKAPLWAFAGDKDFPSMRGGIKL